MKEGYINSFCAEEIVDLQYTLDRLEDTIIDKEHEPYYEIGYESAKTLYKYIRTLEQILMYKD
jgi:hypothetical protein